MIGQNSLPFSVTNFTPNIKFDEIKTLKIFIKGSSSQLVWICKLYENAKYMDVNIFTRINRNKNVGCLSGKWKFGNTW